MILITGASRSIGKFLFEKYSQKGEIVFGTYNSTSESDNNHLFKVDISNHNEVNEWISSLNDLQKVTLINCAGISYNSFAHKADPLEWKKVIDVNPENRICKLNSPYIQDLRQRYLGYKGRVGVPSFPDKLREWILNN